MRREDLETYQRRGRYVRAAVYLRKSRAEEHMSVEETLSRHAAALQDYAQRYGYDVVETYREVVSGESLFARPQMLRLMEAVQAGAYEAVLCMDMQRLGRGGMYDQGFILDTFKQSSTLIVTPDRIYDLSQDLDEEAAEMQTFLSRSEYRMITKRLQRGVLQTVHAGGYMPAAPYGYRKIRKDKLPTLEIVPEEAEIVREIFQRYADGEGCTRIGQALTARGVHGRRCGHMDDNSVINILENPVYVGKVRWNNTSTVQVGVGAERRQKLIYHARGDHEIYDGSHPAIVSQALWDAVQARRDSRFHTVDNKHVASPLAGLVRCSRCGKRMHMHSHNDQPADFCCRTKGCCAGSMFHYVEQAVLDSLREIADSIEIRLSQEAEPDVSSLRADLDGFRSQLVRLESRRSRLYAFLEDGTYTRDLFAQRMEVLAQEEDDTRAAITSTELEIQRRLSRNQRAQLQQIRTVLDAYASASLPARKDLLHSVIREIRYTKEKGAKPADFTLSIDLVDFI